MANWQDQIEREIKRKLSDDEIAALGAAKTVIADKHYDKRKEKRVLRTAREAARSGRGFKIDGIDIC